MTDKIDELMWLVDEYAAHTVNFMNYQSEVNHKAVTEAEVSLRQALEAALKPDPSCDDVKLAETIMSDCGHSTNNTRLLERITNRIALHTAPPAQTHEGESYDDLWNALHQINSVAQMLPTFDARHDGGLKAFVQNIVDAISAATPPAQTPHDHGPQAETVAEAARDVGKWLNERPSRPLDLRHVAMLVAHVQTPPPEPTPINEVIAQWDADLAQGQMAPEQAADFVRREREFAAAQTPVPPRIDGLVVWEGEPVRTQFGVNDE